MAAAANEARFVHPSLFRALRSNGVFSMDGDIAPLPEIVQFAERYDARWWKSELAKLGFDTMGSETPITPVYCGKEEKAVKLEKMLWDEGVYALSICYPTVPKGKARIRTMPSAAHTKEELARALDAFAKCGKTLGIIGEHASA